MCCKLFPEKHDKITFAVLDSYIEKKFCDKEGKLVAPRQWPRNMNIPVAIPLNSKDFPQKGTWIRAGVDLMVWALLRALALAKKTKQSNEVINGFTALAKSAMFDFILVPPGDAEMVLRAQLREDNEELREWFGLDGAGLIKLVEDTVSVLQERAAADAKIEASAVRDYLVEKINWSSEKRIPSVETCNNLMQIVAMFAKVPLAGQISQLSKVMFGRDSLFGEHSKLYITLQKCPGHHEFSYVLHGTWCDMVRQKKPKSLQQWRTEIENRPYCVLGVSQKVVRSLEEQVPLHSFRDLP